MKPTSFEFTPSNPSWVLLQASQLNAEAQHARMLGDEHVNEVGILLEHERCARGA
jgi:hypothetical protein